MKRFDELRELCSLLQKEFVGTKYNGKIVLAIHGQYHKDLIILILLDDLMEVEEIKFKNEKELRNIL